MSELTRSGVFALNEELRLSTIELFCRMTPVIQMLVVFQSPFRTLMHGLPRFPVTPCSLARVCKSDSEYNTGLPVACDGLMTLE